MNRCPLCFTATAGPQVGFVCTSQECGSEPQPGPSAVLGHEIVTKPVTVVNPPAPGGPAQPRPGCRECRQPLHQRCCVVCYARLSSDWLSTATTCAAMTGARTTGKSVYVAVAVHQLQRLAHLHGIPFAFFDGASQETFRNVYERALFEDARVMPATAAAMRDGVRLPPPLIMRFGSLPDGRPHHLVLRDVPGENLENPTIDAALFSFLRCADALLFLVDPLTIRAVAAMHEHRDRLGADPEHVLDGLSRILRDGPHGAVQVRLGVILSKFDTVQGLADVESSRWANVLNQSGLAVNRDESLDSPAFDLDDSELLQLELQSLMQQLKGVEFLNRIRTTFQHHQLFAASALGNKPVGMNLHRNGIAPFRVLDPLKWAFAMSGAVQAVRGASARAR